MASAALMAVVQPVGAQPQAEIPSHKPSSSWTTGPVYAERVAGLITRPEAGVTAIGAGSASGSAGEAIR